jgi:hypothetical protein
MNFFGGEPVQQGPSPLFAAKTDLEMYTDMFAKYAFTIIITIVSVIHIF